MGLFGASRAIPADFQSRHRNPEAAVLRHLTFKILKNIADELHDPATTKTCDMDVVAVDLALVIMALAMNVHEIEFVDQAVALEQAQSPIDGAAVDTGIKFFRFAEKLRGVQMFGRGFHNAKDGTALLRHANAAFGEMGLQATRYFSLG